MGGAGEDNHRSSTLYRIIYPLNDWRLLLKNWFESCNFINPMFVMLCYLMLFFYHN